MFVCACPRGGRCSGAMSGDYEEDVCRSALTLVKELCFSLRALEQHEKCLEFTDLLRNRGHPRPTDAGKGPPLPPPLWALLSH